MFLCREILILSTVYTLSSESNEGVCSKESKYCTRSSSMFGNQQRYLLYDVNYPEGFNLRRDVYMRLAIFVHHLQKQGLDWHLVLPPWHQLYHWKSKEIGKQNFIPWSSFFDLNGMKRFSPVMEFNEFLDQVKRMEIDDVYVLKYYKEAFTTKNWDWSDRWSLSDCDEKTLCENLPANLCENAIYLTVMIDHAEVVVHDGFGDSTYWKCRRSMRFSNDLRRESDNFRISKLGCNDTTDGTVRPILWEDENDHRKARGGPYICAHLRRGDFAYGRKDQIPSMAYAGEQIAAALKEHKLTTVFLASDGSSEDVEILKRIMSNITIKQYKPDLKTRTRIKDGGQAIVDQIICSYARYFIGTHESTFTFRIQEEREIMGFPVDTSFNSFCATSEKCFESSRWHIIY